jgi:hypothetical protein
LAAGAARAAQEIFGLTRDAVVDRDYRWLLDGLKVPVDAIVADQPREPVRPFDELPSMTSTDDRG